MGFEKSIELWRSNQNFEAIFVNKQGTIYVTSGVNDAFETEYEYNVIDSSSPLE